MAKIFKALYKKEIGLSNIKLNSNNLIPLNKVKDNNENKEELNSCQELIDYYFNLNLGNKNKNKSEKENIDIDIINPNYYQKKMFIDLLSYQFIRFTKSDFLQPNILFQNLSIIHKSRNYGKEKTTAIREQ